MALATEEFQKENVAPYEFLDEPGWNYYYHQCINTYQNDRPTMDLTKFDTIFKMYDEEPTVVQDDVPDSEMLDLQRIKGEEK